MIKVLYVYQNYRSVYSSASLSILRGFKQLEFVNVKEFEIQPISYNHLYSRILNRISFLSKAHFRKQNDKLLEEVRKKKFDLMFVMKGTDISHFTLKTIKAENPELKMACFNPDDPFNMASSNSDIIQSIPLYDVYCIWTKHLNQKLKEAGAKEIYYFPFAVDEDIIYPIDQEYKYEVSFIGNGDEERHQLIKSLAEEFNNRAMNVKVHVFGNNWPEMAENVIFHGQRNGKELLKTISASKINLNLLRMQNKNSINMRTFEIPAAKGFLLHEKSEEAELFFSADQEVVYFDSISDLAEKCNLYLSNEKFRKSLMQNATTRLENDDYSYKSIVSSFVMEYFD